MSLHSQNTISDAPPLSLDTSTSLSLVTSFWAVQLDNNTNLHRQEIEAAMLNNLNNPHFDQILVFLDHATEQSNCTHFRYRMAQLQERFDEKMQTSIVSEAYQSQKKKPVLDCVEISEQPNYYQMFLLATGSNVKGDVVIVENADQAFDDSVQWAKHIKNTTVLALSTWGFQPDIVPSPIKDHFNFVHGENSKEYHAEILPRCNDFWVYSWDGYVFHKQLIAGRLKAENFQRPTVKMMNDSTHETAFFKMNEDGGENAALWALLEGIPEVLVSNG
ncbi:expressed unknown protein [Seminavis robusta]|uniref:Uncharacterized protein n=1 Tax=Seminavis robusta TaxID=568900 RepID=A0A9N8HZ32_9STRA|nr:expressed unknown protein [Seminavis robusta]|eukprot:Sro3217_g345470.1 n/a (275) ;mRNA; f:4995-5819